MSGSGAQHEFHAESLAEDRKPAFAWFRISQHGAHYHGGLRRICLLLVFLNFASPFRDRMAEAPNYTDVLVAEHTAENTDFTEAIHGSNEGNEAH